MRKTLFGAAAAALLIASPAHAQDQDPQTPVPDAPSVTALPADRLPTAEDLVGRTLVGTRDQRIGEVSDVLLDEQGGAHSLVVDVEDALGTDREIIVRIEQGKVFLHEHWIAVEGLTLDDVASLPEFQGEEGLVSLRETELDRGDRYPAGVAPLPGWFAEPQPDFE